LNHSPSRRVQHFSGIKSRLKAGLHTATALVALGLTGCGFESAKAKAPVPKPAEVTKSPAWNWDSYPSVTRMRVATLPCQLQPKSAITMQSPMMGMLRVYANSPQTNLPAGFLWAEFEPEIFAAEETALKEAQKKLDDQEELQWQVEYPRKKLEVQQRIEEAERQVNIVRLLAANTNMAMAAFGFAGQSNLLRPDALEKSEANLRLLKQSLAFLDSTNFAAVGVDLAGARTDWQKRTLEHQKQRAQSIFKMPFDGRLTISLPLTEGVQNYPVTAGQELGIARDLSAIRVRVVVENSAWSGLPADKLRAVVATGSEFLEAKFAYQKIERFQNREEPAYYFEFPREKAATAARLIGANVSCDLFIDLPEPVRVVPKFSLVLHDPNAFQNRNWSSALTTLFPGVRLVVEGQTELGVALPKEMKLSSAK
jgi:hypothetical protein